ncbi:MAG TPA: hypothetical protein VD838_00520 [Anaeromyxobacteraceae bacterium]|nr:hypothetical protein [Anaeromyxobacteraceae bacterium]
MPKQQPPAAEQKPRAADPKNVRMIARGRLDLREAGLRGQTGIAAEGEAFLAAPAAVAGLVAAKKAERAPAKPTA